MKISDKLHNLRKDKGWTLKDLHLELNQVFGKKDGLSIPYLSEVERGASSPSLKTLEKLARVYDISMSQLLLNVDNLEIDLKDSLSSTAKEAFITFQKLLKEMEKVELNEEWINTLLKIEYRGKHPETPNGWYEMYNVLKKSLE